jgi:hypothetical protein
MRSAYLYSINRSNCVYYIPETFRHSRRMSINPVDMYTHTRAYLSILTMIVVETKKNDTFTGRRRQYHIVIIIIHTCIQSGAENFNFFFDTLAVLLYIY